VFNLRYHLLVILDGGTPPVILVLLFYINVRHFFHVNFLTYEGTHRIWALQVHFLLQIIVNRLGILLPSAKERVRP